MNQGLISLSIPIIVIILEMTTKKIIASLITGILSGGILLAKGNIINGFIVFIDQLVTSVVTEESTYIVMFLFLFGALGEIIKVSGGIKGFSELADKYIKTEKGALVSHFLSGETVILSSTIAEVPLMKHIKTILPYSIVSIIISAILFMIFAIV